MADSELRNILRRSCLNSTFWNSYRVLYSDRLGCKMFQWHCVGKKKVVSNISSQQHYHSHTYSGKEKVQNVRVKTIFLLGKDPRKGTKKSEIENENEIHGDILMVWVHQSLKNFFYDLLYDLLTIVVMWTQKQLISTIHFKTWQ